MLRTYPYQSTPQAAPERVDGTNIGTASAFGSDNSPLEWRKITKAAMLVGGAGALGAGSGMIGQHTGYAGVGAMVAAPLCLLGSALAATSGSDFPDGAPDAQALRFVTKKCLPVSCLGGVAAIVGALVPHSGLVLVGMVLAGGALGAGLEIHSQIRGRDGAA